MDAQTFDLLLAFVQRVLHPVWLVLRNVAAGKHEVLPDQNALAVTEVIEQVSFVKSAAPDAQEIAVSVFCQRQQALVFFVADRAGKAVHRNPVAAPDENVRVIDAQLEAQRVRARRLLHQPDLAECQRSARFADRFARAVERDLVAIQRLCAVAVRPPELRRFNAQIAEIVKKEDELRKAIDEIIAEIEG